MKRMLRRVEARPPDTSPHPATFSRSEAAVSGTSTLCPVTESPSPSSTRLQQAQWSGLSREHCHGLT